MSTESDALQTYYAALVNASDLSTGDKQYALLCLAQWVAAEDALTSLIASPISSYSISGRSVARITQDNGHAAAAAARGRFFESCHGCVTYVDISKADEAVLEPTT